jgi:hypothetical protein
MTDPMTDSDERLETARTSDRASLAPGLDPAILGDIDDLVDAIGQLEAGDCDRLLAFWKGIDPDVRATAVEDARAAAESTDRMTLIRSVQDEILGWTQVRNTGNRPSVERWFAPVGGAALNQSSWIDAMPALADATTALALQDVLDDTDFDALFGPWLNAMGSAVDDDTDADSDAAGETTDADKPQEP